MPKALLRSALALWITNILVFALWYWKLGAGGPLGRDHSRCKIASAFLFPQHENGRSPIPDGVKLAVINALNVRVVPSLGQRPFASTESSPKVQ